MKVTGRIVTAGSSKVYPLSEAVAEQFVKKVSAARSHRLHGSGAGFDRFPRPARPTFPTPRPKIKQSNIEAAAKLNPPRLPIEFRIGTDALAVVVSSTNGFVKNLTIAELGAIFSTAQYWSDVRKEWPKQEIKRFSPGTDSGTFDYFVEHVFKKDKKPILSARNLQLSEDDNVLVQGILTDQFAIGYFGYAYAAENKGKLKAVSIEGIEPTRQPWTPAPTPGQAPLPLLRQEHHTGQAPGCRLPYLLPYLRERSHKEGRLLPGSRGGS
jgi:phosphate transport system substrate-binding protein